jgi:2-oxoglutarate ferredoxin oxidoreductase subunit alpha
VIEHADSPVGVVCYGSVEPAVQEARDVLREEHGIKTGYMRVRALPLTQEVFDFVDRYERVYVFESNTEGQLRQIMLLEMPQHGIRLQSMAYLDGLSMSAAYVVSRVLEQEGR